MKNLVIDIENSRIKSALFARDKLFEGAVFADLHQGITAWRVNFPEISIYLCGGDAESFDSLAKDHIFVVPNLVLIGLNCFLNHHVA
jgi:pantothenate kinase type III